MGTSQKMFALCGRRWHHCIMLFAGEWPPHSDVDEAKWFGLKHWWIHAPVWQNLLFVAGVIGAFVVIAWLTRNGD